MDLHELSSRSGIAVRKLRYCLDHDLVPGLQIDLKETEVGRPRKFSEDAGFAILCAALLQIQGLPHPKIRLFLKAMASDLQKLIHILESGESAEAQLGDGQNFRIVVASEKSSPRWSAPGNPAKLDRGYRPLVIVTLDLGAIRQTVYSE